MRLPEIKGKKDCGARALTAACRMMQRETDYAAILELASPDKDGVSLLKLKNAAEKTGLSASLLRTNIEGLRSLNKPVIVHLRWNHYEVISASDKSTVTLNGRAFFKKIPNWLFRLGWSGAVMTISNK